MVMMKLGETDGSWDKNDDAYRWWITWRGRANGDDESDLVRRDGVMKTLRDRKLDEAEMKWERWQLSMLNEVVMMNGMKCAT